MRILLLSQWYAPEPDFKVQFLAKDLMARGHRVEVLTGFPNYPQGQIYSGYRQRLWQRQQVDGVPVLRVALYPDHSRSSVRRSLNYLSFAVSASVWGPWLSRSADAMWVYSAPLTTGIPAWVIGTLRRIPFVFNIHDLWPETLSATGLVGSGRVTRSLDQLARFIYRRAAAITVVSPGFQRNLIAKGVPAEKVHLVPNWADETIYRPVEPDPALAAQHGLAGRFNVMFAGNMGAAQDMDNVLAAAALLRDVPAVQFVLVGDGIDADRIRAAAAQSGLENVRFIARQPAEQMPGLFALADVLLVHLKRDPLFEITIPSKVAAYLACGRPILCNVLGDAADVVRDAGAGLLCPPQDPAALAAAVLEFYQMPRCAREAMGQSGRRAYLATYTRHELVSRYEALLAAAAASRSQAADVAGG